MEWRVAEMMNKKMTYIIAAVILILSCGAEMAGIHLHSPSWWPLPFGYSVFFGFVACWALIIMAKLIMAPLLQRDEDYYDRRGGDNDE